MTTNSEPSANPDPAGIEDRLARVDGIMGAAGHHLDDPYLRELLAKRIAGEISADDYDRLGMAHLRTKASR